MEDNEVREVIEVREDIEVKKLGRTRSQGIETFSTQILKSSNSQINQNPNLYVSFIMKHFMAIDPLVETDGQVAQSKSAYKTHDYIDDIVSLNVNRSSYKRQVNRDQTSENNIFFISEYHDHNNCRDAYVRARERSGGSFAQQLRFLYKVEKHAGHIMIIHEFIIIIEIVTQSQKVSIPSIVNAYGLKVILRTCCRK